MTYSLDPYHANEVCAYKIHHWETGEITIILNELT